MTQIVHNRIYQIIGFNGLFVHWPTIARPRMRPIFYAAILKYIIKLNTSIFVPEVFACCTKLEKGNDVGSSYVLMERLSGRMAKSRRR